MIKQDDWGRQAFAVQNPGSEPPFTIIANGRVRWALECLIAAGAKGCTPIDTPGPRWSHYVWMLREDGVEIETITEPHGGPFRGTHARCVLHARVKPISSSEVAA